ncbi:MAG TPA: GTP cyclohydrolase I FolE [Candidatus Saccharimonadales bacterium]|nr:GTP cyclohydrolase I FolE [Candidatus Saccharimonadales bacterium]
MKQPDELITELLKHLDQNPGREGLRETPQRYAKFLEEFVQNQPPKITVFDSEGYDEMVIQTRIPFYSICEHHLVPFFGYGAIAYIPNEKIIGLSKLARILDYFSHRLQNQERITKEVAEFLAEAVQPKGVGVILEARHLCMEMRGVQKPDTLTTTSTVRGIFKSDPRTRGEFVQLAKAGK